MNSKSRMIASALALLLATTGAAMAQSAVQTASPPPASPPSAGAPAAATPSEMTKDGKPRMKFVREQCRAEVKSAGLKGDARRQAMGECVVKARPDKAAQVKCSMDPQMKGMDKAARRAFMKDCVGKTKS